MSSPGSDADILAQFAAAKEELARRLLAAEPGLTRAQAVRRSATPDPQRNVQAIGIGPKVVAGRLTPDMSVKIFVHTKRPSGEIGRGEALPDTVSGLPTDVEEIGLVQPLGRIPSPRGRIRPVRPGCSIGFQTEDPQDAMAGTFGALVHDAGGLYILSNNHVLADQNRLPFGSAIFAPGLFDGGNPTHDQVAVLEGYVPLDLQAPNFADAAIARLLDDGSAAPGILQIGAPAGQAVASLGQTVEKSGRTTRYTRGIVASINTDVKVPYDIGTVLFQDQIAIRSMDERPFSEPGDSGALVLESGTGVSVGLLFAGSPAISFANHIRDALDAFGVELVLGP